MTFLRTLFSTLLVQFGIFVFYINYIFCFCTPTHTAWCFDIYNLFHSYVTCALLSVKNKLLNCSTGLSQNK